MSTEPTNSKESSKEKKRVFDKILDEDDPKKRSQLIEFYKVIVEVENEEQTEKGSY